MENKQVISSPDVNKVAMEKVFDKMYITNVENRLRALNVPSMIDKKRWIWELIQNAKDTIALDPNKNEINTQGRIFREGDKVMQIKNNYDIYWEKERLTNISQVKRRAGKTVEIISMFYKKQPTYNPQMIKYNGPKRTNKIKNGKLGKFNA